MGRHGRGVIAWMAGMTGAAGMASAAWACTMPVSELGVSPPAGSPSTVVRVQGERMGLARDGRPSTVELRWDGAAGDLLTRAVADPFGNFSVDLPLPHGAPGIHSLVAVSNGVAVGRAAVQVTPDPSSLEPVTAPVADLAAPSAGTGVPSITSQSREPTLSPGAALGAMALVSGAAGLGVVAVRRRRAAETRH